MAKAAYKSTIPVYVNGSLHDAGDPIYCEKITGKLPTHLRLINMTKAEKKALDTEDKAAKDKAVNDAAMIKMETNDASNAVPDVSGTVETL